MRAVRCEAWGGPETLVIGDVPSRALDVQEVRVAVHAAGLNFTDALIIQGSYQVKPPLPFTPGAEAAGVVIETGSAVRDLVVGQRVACLNLTGAFAEELVLPAQACFPLPDAIPFDVGAVLPASYGTAWHALQDRGAARAGETVLVLGAAGGVGLSAVQVGKALGLRVIAAASSPEKLAVCRACGADALIDYAQEDLRAGIREHTEGKGIDLVIDGVGGAASEAAFRSIARGGRHLVIGFASGQIPALPWNLPLLKAASIVGVYWGDCVRSAPERARAQMNALMVAVAQGRIDPHISGRCSMDQVPAALARMLARGVIGKSVMTLGRP